MFVSSATINRKIMWVLGVVVVTFVIIVLRLIYLQMYCGEYFSFKSQKNFTRYITVDCPRGSIRDVQGNLLATNRPVTTVYWQGTGNVLLSDEQILVLRFIELSANIALS